MMPSRLAKFELWNPLSKTVLTKCSVYLTHEMGLVVYKNYAIMEFLSIYIIIMNGFEVNLWRLISKLNLDIIKCPTWTIWCTQWSWMCSPCVRRGQKHLTGGKLVLTTKQWWQKLRQKGVGFIAPLETRNFDMFLYWCIFYFGTTTKGFFVTDVTRLVSNVAAEYFVRFTLTPWLLCQTCYWTRNISLQNYHIKLRCIYFIFYISIMY